MPEKVLPNVRKFERVNADYLYSLPRIGGMATMPSQLPLLRKSLPRILPQIEKLYIYFDKYDELPPESRHPKVVPMSSSGRTISYRSSGKFLGLLSETKPIVYITFDDDILYARAHVPALVAGLVRHGGRAVVGYHGSRFKPGAVSYIDDRDVINFHKGLLFDREVDLLGTGTCAIASQFFDFDPRQWPHFDMDDLLLGLEAERRGIPRFALRRRRWFLRAIETNQSDSIYAQTVADETRHAPYLNELLSRIERRKRAAGSHPDESSPAP